MRKHLFQIIAIFLMVSIGIVYSISFVKKDDNTFKIDLDDKIEELVKINTSDSNGVVVIPTDEAPKQVKTIKEVKYYKGDDEFNPNDYYQIPLGYFNDNNFSYKVFYTDDSTPKTVAINEDNLASFIGKTYAEKILYSAGKYTIDLLYKGTNVKIKIESTRENAKEYDVIYTYRRKTHATIHVTYGDIVPHLNGQVANPVKDPGSIYTYSFTKWNYEGDGHINYRDVTDQTNSIVNIVGLYNCAQANRNISLKDNNYVCVNDFSAGNYSGFDPQYSTSSTELVGIYHIGKVEGLQVWASTTTINKTSDTNITYDFNTNFAPLIMDNDDTIDKQKKELILGRLFENCNTSVSKLVVNLVPGICFNKTISTSSIGVEDELGNMYYCKSAKSLEDYLKKDTGYQGNIRLNDELDDADPDNNPINYVLGLFVDCHIYVCFKSYYDTSTHTVNHSEAYEFFLVPDSHYFAVTTENTTEPDKKIKIDFDKLKEVAEKTIKEVSAL